MLYLYQPSFHSLKLRNKTFNLQKTVYSSFNLLWGSFNNKQNCNYLYFIFETAILQAQSIVESNLQQSEALNFLNLLLIVSWQAHTIAWYFASLKLFSGGTLYFSSWYPLSAMTNSFSSRAFLNRFATFSDLEMSHNESGYVLRQYQQCF